MLYGAECCALAGDRRPATVRALAPFLMGIAEWERRAGRAWGGFKTETGYPNRRLLQPSAALGHSFGQFGGAHVLHRMAREVCGALLRGEVAVDEAAHLLDRCGGFG